MDSTCETPRELICHNKRTWNVLKVQKICFYRWNLMKLNQIKILFAILQMLLRFKPLRFQNLKLGKYFIQALIFSASSSKVCS